MSSNRRKFHVKHPVVVDVGCSCRRPKLSSFFLSPFKKSHNNKSNNYQTVFSPSTASLTTATTAPTNASSSSSSFSPSNFTSSPPSQAFYSTKQGSSRRRKAQQQQQQQLELVEESVAVEKESSDPYVDFRDSMLQMIVEKEIYTWEELRQLLQLLLSLNSPYHHHLILQAFAEIWNGVFSPARQRAAPRVINIRT